MSKARKRHTRKRRRAMKAALRHGPRAKPTHKSKTGRTGGVFYKRLESRRCKKSKRVNSRASKRERVNTARTIDDISYIHSLYL